MSLNSQEFNENKASQPCCRTHLKYLNPVMRRGDLCGGVASGAGCGTAAHPNALLLAHSKEYRILARFFFLRSNYRTDDRAVFMLPVTENGLRINLGLVLYTMY